MSDPWADFWLQALPFVMVALFVVLFLVLRSRRTAQAGRREREQERRRESAAVKGKVTAAVTPCPICGSTAVKFRHSRGRKVALTWWLWAMNKKPYCAQCGTLRTV